MRGLMVWALVLACAPSWATQYYVSNSGSDSNNGTSAVTPWQTLAKVNSSTFNGGDTIYLQRGGVWRESLIPPSSGTSASPITFDAYGSGAPPVLTAATPTSFVSGTWSYISGSVWKAALSTTIASPTVNMVQFGNIWGRRQPYGSGCATSIVSKYDWCLSWPYLYVYSPSGTNPVSEYAADGSIVPIIGQVSGLGMIAVMGKTYVTFQHIKIQDFDYVGVNVSGASDYLVFANMESDGMVPYGTTPLGFYVNVSSGYGTSIQFLNDDAQLNYDGFKVDGATAVQVVNCRAYGNRAVGLDDNTASGTVVAYSYSHFYGNNVAQLLPADAIGGVPGNGNVGLVCGAAADYPTLPNYCSSYSPPTITNFATYPARFSFTVDDVGSQPNTESYIDTFLAVGGPYTTRSWATFNAAVVPSYSVVWSDVNNWYAAGDEIDSHSWSHQYYSTNTNPQNATPYPNAPALNIQYTGSGTAATMTISGGTLTTSVTGAAGDNLNINLSSYTNATLVSYLNSLAYYAAQNNLSTWPLDRPNTHTTNFLNVSNQNIKTAAYTILYDQTKLEPDEMESSQTAIENNVTGLAEEFYVYPDGIEDPTIEADATAAGYTAARGSLAMKGQDNTTVSANSLYSNGVNVQNITSLGAIQIYGLTQTQTNQIVASMVFRAEAWGAPYGFFTHYNSRGDSTPDISNTELGYLLDAVHNNGGVWLTNTALANAVTTSPAVNLSGSTRYVQNPTGAAVNLTVAGANSPTVGRGIATAYPIDLNGVNRATLGAWDIGASAYLSQRYGTGAGTGTTYVGGWTQSPCGWPTYGCGSTSVATLAYPSTAPNTGGITGAGTTFVDPMFGTPGVRVTDANFDPSMAGSTNNVYSVSNGGSSDNNWWSTDSKLMLVTNGGSTKYLVGFNPATLQISRPYASATNGCPRGTGNCASYGGWSTGGDIEFSQANACEVYSFSGSTITSYTFGSDVSAFPNSCSTNISGPPAGVTTENFIENSPAGCVGAACNCLPSDFGTPTWNSESGTTAGDGLFGEAFTSSAYHYGSGTGQGNGYYAAVWSPTKGCMAYNTQTGAIAADPGWAGGAGLTCTASGCTGTTTAGATFTIHNMKCSADGTRCYIQHTTCLSGTCVSSNPYVWITGTTTVYMSEDSTKTSGHWCAGYAGIINEPGSPLWQWYYRTDAASGSPGTPVALNTLPTPNPTVSLDAHCGWQMDNTTDSAPVLWTSATNNYLLPQDQPQGPWWDEIDLTDTNGDGFTHREALTFNTGWSTIFAAQNNITAASKQCVAVGSDWFNIRNAGGTATSCIPSGPTWTASYAYGAGYVVNPAAANNAGNYSYQIAAGCTSGTTQPAAWNQTVGGPQADGTCTWTNVGVATGANKCGTDVFAWCFEPPPAP